MQQPKHIVIVAGEESGDCHAANLIKELKMSKPTLRVSGIGGQHMQKAGAHLIADLASQGVTGITEVIRHFRTLKRAFDAIKSHLATTKPDLLILVDYPGFNLRLARYAKQKLGIKILYYISPQIWAWKAKRIHLIKQCVDHMAVILPFEKDLYTKAEVPVSFVGHPLVDTIKPKPDMAAIRQSLQLPQDRQIIALLPGSRLNEIERHMPVLRDMAQLIHAQHPKLLFLIPVASSLKSSSIQAYLDSINLPYKLVAGRAQDCMAAADFVVVASGTASLECALLAKPMCIIYKTSFITYHAAMKLIKVRFLGLCNLLMNQMVVPEFLQYDCNAKELSNHILQYLKAPETSAHMQSRLEDLHASMSIEKSDCSLIKLVENELSEKKA